MGFLVSLVRRLIARSPPPVNARSNMHKVNINAVVEHIHVLTWVLLVAFSVLLYLRGIPRQEDASRDTQVSHPTSDATTTAGPKAYYFSLFDKNNLEPGLTAPGRNVEARLGLVEGPTQLCLARLDLQTKDGQSVARAEMRGRCTRSSEQLHVDTRTGRTDGEVTLVTNIPKETPVGTELSATITATFFPSSHYGTIQRGGLVEKSVYFASKQMETQVLHSPMAMYVAQVDDLAKTPLQRRRAQLRTIAIQHAAIAVVIVLVFGVLASLSRRVRNETRDELPVLLLLLANAFFISLYFFLVVANETSGYAMPMLVLTAVIGFVSAQATFYLRRTFYFTWQWLRLRLRT
jgi:hypothetical protein